MAKSATKAIGASFLRHDISGWLGLAAAPTFALLAGITVVTPPGMTICTARLTPGPFSDMALMYLLMGLFHLSPWLTLISARSHRQIEGD